MLIFHHKTFYEDFLSVLTKANYPEGAIYLSLFVTLNQYQLDFLLSEKSTFNLFWLKCFVLLKHLSSFFMSWIKKSEENLMLYFPSTKASKIQLLVIMVIITHSV